MRIARLVCIFLASFGVSSGQPLDLIFVLEMSQGTEQAIGLIHPRDLGEHDRAAVIGFMRTATVLQPLTDDHDKVAKALQSGGFRTGVAPGKPGGAPLNLNNTVDLAGALKFAAGEFEHDESGNRKRAIIVLFAAEDPNLGTQMDSLKRMLGRTDALLYAVVVERVNALDVPPIARSGGTQIPSPSPIVTAQFLSQLASESGGRVFRRNWNLKMILEQARKP